MWPNCGSGQAPGPKKIPGLRKIACHCRISASKGVNLLYLISECPFQYKFVRGCVCMPVYMALPRPMQRISTSGGEIVTVWGRICQLLGENVFTLYIRRGRKLGRCRTLQYMPRNLGNCAPS